MSGYIEPKAWPEVEPPKGWKKNPKAGRLLTWILLGTVLVCGTVAVVSASTSEVLPMLCFVALVLLPFAGPAAARIGYGTNYREAREMHRVTPADVQTEEIPGGCCMTAYRGPYQKLDFPDELNGRPITQAAPRLFQDNQIIAFVHLPGGLTEVSEGMFCGCSNLPEIMLPVSVTCIGSRAFAGCVELKEVYITAATTRIAPDAFDGCGTLLFHVQEGSAAEAFAQEKGFLVAHR